MQYENYPDEKIEYKISTLYYNKDNQLILKLKGEDYDENKSYPVKLIIEGDINYKKEYTFNSCKDHKPLPFDFYLTKYDCLIEIDGEQHFEVVRFGGISEDKAQKNFENQKYRDKIKNDFCKDNNIPLLRIPYWEFQSDNYKQIFLNFIKPFKINDLE
jgi:hypothetical protein